MQKEGMNRSRRRLRNWRKALELFAFGSPTIMANLARAYVASGNRAGAETLLADLKICASTPDYFLLFGDCGDLCGAWR